MLSVCISIKLFTLFFRSFRPRCVCVPRLHSWHTSTLPAISPCSILLPLSVSLSIAFFDILCFCTRCVWVSVLFAPLHFNYYRTQSTFRNKLLSLSFILPTIRMCCACSGTSKDNSCFAIGLRVELIALLYVMMCQRMTSCFTFFTKKSHKHATQRNVRHTHAQSVQSATHQYL